MCCGCLLVFVAVCCNVLVVYFSLFVFVVCYLLFVVCFLYADGCLLYVVGARCVVFMFGWCLLLCVVVR